MIHCRVCRQVQNNVDLTGLRPLHEQTGCVEDVMFVKCARCGIQQEACILAHQMLQNAGEGVVLQLGME